MRRGPPPRAGCGGPESSCSRRKRELIKLRGLHPIIEIHLAHRSWHIGAAKIQAVAIDGFIQRLRLSLKEDAVKYAKPPAAPKFKQKPKSSGNSGGLTMTDQLPCPNSGGLTNAAQPLFKYRGVRSDISPSWAKGCDVKDNMGDMTLQGSGGINQNTMSSSRLPRKLRACAGGSQPI